MAAVVESAAAGATEALIKILPSPATEDFVEAVPGAVPAVGVAVGVPAVAPVVVAVGAAV